MILSRRGFLGVLAGAVAAPAVVRSGVLMPLRGVVIPTEQEVQAFVNGQLVYDTNELSAVVRRAFVPRLFVQAWREPPLTWLLQNTEFFGTR